MLHLINKYLTLIFVIVTKEYSMDIFSSLNTYYNNPAGTAGAPQNLDTTDPDQIALYYEQSFSDMLNSIFNSTSNSDDANSNNSLFTMDQLGLGLENPLLNISQPEQAGTEEPNTEQAEISAEEFMSSVYNNLSSLFNDTETQDNTFDSLSGYYNILQNNLFSGLNTGTGATSADENPDGIAQQLNASSLNSLYDFFGG
ncbi:MAG: hypothetical protein ABIH39_02435 [Candidatus Margulisiibacteriota bacterium]